MQATLESIDTAGPGDIYFQDVVPGTSIATGSYAVTADDIIAFAGKWDPLPIHVDPGAAAASAFGGLTASGSHVLAIKQLLVHGLPLRHTVICSLGYDEIRFKAPVRPGDVLSIEVTWIDKRVSRSAPDRGVVTLGFRLFNADGETVLSHRDSVLMRLRAD